MINTQMVGRAMELAYVVHQGQVRKGNGQPYINHPKRIAATVENIEGTTTEMICAAWLHDTLEDTKAISPTVLAETILHITNDTVLQYVMYMTEDKRYMSFEKELRSARYREQLKHAPAEVHTIKLADMFDNMSELTRMDDTEWAIKQVQKRALMLPNLTRGDSNLFITVEARIHSLKQYFNLE